MTSSIQRAPWKTSECPPFNTPPLYLATPGGQGLTSRNDPALRHSTGQASGSSGLTLKPEGLPLAGPGDGPGEPTPRPRGMPGAVPGLGPQLGSLRTWPVPARAAILGPMWRCRAQAGIREAGYVIGGPRPPRWAGSAEGPLRSASHAGPLPAPEGRPGSQASG